MKRKLIYTLLILALTCFIYTLSCHIKHKDTVAIIGALDEEINDFTITTGTLGNNNIILAKSGVGKVAASITAHIQQKLKLNLFKMV